MYQSTTDCKSCGKPIVFLKTKTGRMIPVDSCSLADRELIDYQNGADIVFDNNRHVTHFATCPNADFHRSKS